METVEMTSVVNHCDGDGRTPLHLAASMGYKVRLTLSLSLSLTHPHTHTHIFVHIMLSLTQCTLLLIHRSVLRCCVCVQTLILSRETGGTEHHWMWLPLTAKKSYSIEVWREGKGEREREREREKPLFITHT